MIKRFYLDHLEKKITDRDDHFLNLVYSNHHKSVVALEFNSVTAFDFFPINTVIDPSDMIAIKEGRIDLFIVNSHEAFHLPVLIIYRYLIDLAIPLQNVYYCSESANISDVVRHYASTLGILPMNAIWTRRFEYDMLQNALNIFKTTPRRALSPLDNQEFKKKFLLFNRRWRLHRPTLVGILKIKNLIEKGHISLGVSDDHENWSNFWNKLKYHQVSTKNISDELYEYLYCHKDEISSLTDLYLDTTDLVTNRAVSTVDTDYLYNETYFSVITETNFFTKDYNFSGVFFSEKIFKCIANSHPMIVVAPPGTLYKLKELGYKTFAPLINEQYDNETDDSKRLMMIADEIERLSSLPNAELYDFLRKAKKICDYNYKFLMSRQVFHNYVSPTLKEYVIDVKRGQYRGFMYRPDDDILREIDQAVSQGATKIVFDNAKESFVAALTHKTAIHLDINSESDTIRNCVYPELSKIKNMLPNIKHNGLLVELYTGTYNEKQIYDTYCDIFEGKDLDTSNNSSVFFNVRNNDLYQRAVSQPHHVRHPEVDTSFQIIKKFLFYNRMPHAHRVIMVALLIECGIIDHGLVSLYTNLREDFIDVLETVTISDNLKKRVKNIFVQHQDKFPMKLSLLNSGDNPDHISAEDYIAHKQTYFSLVSETEFFKKHSAIPYGDIFFTEKTFKAIRCKQPFIIMGAKYSLQHLHKLGYLTFSNWFNESYDSIDDDETRLVAIQQEMIRLCNSPKAFWQTFEKEVARITEHNYNVLMYRNETYRNTQ